MKILLAPDKFKGSLSAQQVCQALEKGLHKRYPQARIISKPMADGGEGSLDLLSHYQSLRTITQKVQDPLGRLIHASYKLAETTAYIELSAASGLALLEVEERNCVYTSTYGTGELIADALNKGAKEIFLFIGGSATNDGAIGIAKALGYRFYDKNGHEFAPIGKNLSLINRIDASQLVVDLDTISFKTICDVDNPFAGKNGAAHVYAKQKGASLEEIKHLDQGLVNLANQLVTHGFPKIQNIPGAGAAGGVGGGTVAFLNANLLSGIQTFLDLTHLEEEIKDCDLIITGEGKIDQQTERGKVISGVCAIAKKHQKKVIAICGMVEHPISESLGLAAIHSVISKAGSLEEAMKNTSALLTTIATELKL